VSFFRDLIRLLDKPVWKISAYIVDISIWISDCYLMSFFGSILAKNTCFQYFSNLFYFFFLSVFILHTSPVFWYVVAWAHPAPKYIALLFLFPRSVAQKVGYV
jgi:hypothetical protein